MGAALWFWRLGDQRRAQSPVPASSPATAANTNTVAKNVAAANAPAAAKKSLLLSNTSEDPESLARNDHALILRNALIDTTLPLNLGIPDDLHATNGRTFIVQSSHALDGAFYTALEAAGARYVSYIPNNAALVEASPNVAAALTNFIVVPYEPYYKLSSDLLEDAVNHTPIDAPLIVTTPPGTHDEALAQIKSFGWAVVGEDKTPFGPEFVVQTSSPDAPTVVAQWPLAQEVEMFHRRLKMNDLSRVRLGVAPDPISPSNYLGLTGLNIPIGLNDTGVDATHPDLVNRVEGLTDDFDGHGTHVAGILIGDGTNSSTINEPPNLPPGSTAGASFRGMASQAKLWVQPIDLVLGPFISNEYLQTNGQAALSLMAASEAGPTATNGFISNNSWGYGDNFYDINSASFDAAVRDSQPLVSGEQAMTYVFAAGNSGDGSGNGIDGIQNTISSPGTAKNVITVGAIDSPRFITNKASLDCSTSNALFLGPTSDSNLVSYFSSCGNVSPALEGQFGRFKPDVVAPGVFIVSTRNTNFVDPTNESFVDFQTFPGQILQPGETAPFTILVPSDAQYIWIQAVQNVLSINPFPTNIFITAGPEGGGTAGAGFSPLLVTDITDSNFWTVEVSDPGLTQPLNYDLNVYIIETNYLCNYFQVLSNLNSTLKPSYRYESGTSMASPMAAGVLALIQEYFTKNDHFSPSPALLKALLINGARSLGNFYDFNTEPSQANEQGWGLINLPNSLPHTNGTATNLTFLDQSPQLALRTGESATFEVDIPDTNALASPLRVTLVWTDPPGNPAAGIALVNDLDLTVRDSTGSYFYVGNNFHSGDVFTEPGPAAADNINNVENVYIDTSNGNLQPPLFITITGSRVNVNAVTTQTNNIMQDYALVVSSDDSNVSSSITLGSPAISNSQTAPVTISSNNVALTGQRVGANSPYDYHFSTGQTNGTEAQWHFFIFTNDTFRTTGTNFTNVAFVTFLPPELAVPRISQQADIDLYVSTNSALTNLDPTVIAQAVIAGSVSRQRGGNEAVVLSNSFTPNEIYYIGVKSEDQQAAAFGFLGGASLNPFSSQNENGDIVAHAFPTIPPFVPIPDGAFDHPGTTNVFALVEGGRSIQIRHVIVTNGIAHQNPGDLVGALTFGGAPGEQVILNNHSGNSTNYANAYDDQPESAAGNFFVPGYPAFVRYPVHTDGPGNLNQFIGRTVASGSQWQLSETDSALGQTGDITGLDIFMEHQPAVVGGIEIFVDCYLAYYGYVQVPDDTTNLTIAVTYPGNSAGGPVTIYATNGIDVGPDDLDTTNIDTVPGGQLVIDKNSPNPIKGGTWYFLILNPSTTCLNVQVSILQSLVPNWIQSYTNNTPVAIAPNSHTPSEICLPPNLGHGQVVSLDVGVRINDPNLDNLVLHLTSPAGTSALLFENRGGPAATNLGINTSNGYVYTTFTEDTNFTDTLIKFTPTFASSNAIGTTTVTNAGFESPLLPGTYGVGANVDGWIVSTNEVGVVTDPTNAYAGSNFLALTTGTLRQTFATVPGNSYELIYYARQPGLLDWWPGNGNANDIIGTNNGVAQNVIFNQGKSGRGFYFNGTDSLVDFGPQAGNFGTNDFTIDYWVNMPETNIQSQAFFGKRVACDGSFPFWEIRWGDRTPPRAGPGQQGLVVFDSTSFLQSWWTPSLDDGDWHHVVWTRTQTLFSTYTDGVLTTNQTQPIANVTNNAHLLLGFSVCNQADDGTVPYYLGAADEVCLYGRALSPAEIEAIYNAGSVGKGSTNSINPNMTITFDGVSTNLYISPSNTWQAITNIFVATSDHTTVEIAGNSANSMLLDDISFVDLPATNYNNFFMPEESLSSFVGEDPQGCWTLDIWDTRSDSPVDASLLSWTLNMTFSSTNINLIVLTNHVPYVGNTSNLLANTYFAFDVPPTANFATNSLTDAAPANSSLSLVFNQTTLPGPNSPGDFTLIQNTLPPSPPNVLTAQGTPPLVQGSRYFLAVNNSTPATPQNFVLRIDTDNQTNGVTGLTNAVPLAATNNTKLGQLYSFDVPRGAIMATFQLVNITPGGNLNLYARYGLPLPTPSGYDYQSVAAGSVNQSIVVYSNSPPFTNSSPVRLLPGNWYLSVYNTGATPVTYNIIATYYTNISTNAIIIIPLTNGIAYANTAPAGFSPIYYSFTNDVIDSGVSFGVSNIVGGNVDLLVGMDSLPSPQQSYNGSFNPGTLPEFVQTPSSGPHVWYLAVPNNGNTPVTYTITANDLQSGTVTNFPPITGGAYTPGLGFTITWNSIIGAVYQVDYSTDLINWTIAVTFTATNTTSSFTDFTPPTGPGRFYRVEQVP
jgi:subtilisin-like proprotein convertase family protein